MSQIAIEESAAPQCFAKLEKIGVVGAGVMGTGVAQNLAQSGFQVVLIDIGRETLHQAKSRIRQGLQLQKLMNKNAFALPTKEALENICFSQNIESLNTVDYVIENVTEEWDIKRAVYSRLDAICRPECIFAANTSAISIARLASATSRASQVVGIHFMNSVPMKKTVEVIRSPAASEATIQVTCRLLRAMGKDWVMVNDAPGFVSNRVLMLTINEAVALVHEGVAAPEAVDKVFRDCFAHKMGPLETADLIGLDTIVSSLAVLYEAFGNEKYQPCSLLKQMVAMGSLGRKTGKGFYIYESNSSNR